MLFKEFDCLKLHALSLEGRCLAALFFAQAQWDGNIGRESAALIESSLLSAALVPGRALHLMGGDAHARFHRAREAPDRYGLAPHGPCRPFQGTQAGLEA